MGYGLLSKNKEFYTNLSGFPKLLQLAYLFGWNPRGTESPEIDPGGNVIIDKSAWDGGYFSNDLQYVTEEDAEEIAVSLKKALQYIPDTDSALGESIHTSRILTLEEFVEKGIFSKRKVINWITEEEKDRLISRFIGQKDYVKEFIDLCEDGVFMIS